MYSNCWIVTYQKLSLFSANQNADIDRTRDSRYKMGRTVRRESILTETRMELEN